tara:strand:- start:15 stop:596 length:582 start_codon:yes stop_codon:yes gene_type:complete
MSVYIIVDKNEPSMYYLGSTKNMSRRKPVHKSDCKTSDTKVYRYIREHGGWDNFEFEVIEECDNYFEREKELIIELEPPLNMVQYVDSDTYPKDYYEANKETIAKRAKARYQRNKEKNVEYAKTYRKEYKEQIAERAKAYREEHKDKMRERDKAKYQKFKVKINCECGLIVRKNDILRHKKTKKHKSLMENID